MKQPKKNGHLNNLEKIMLYSFHSTLKRVCALYLGKCSVFLLGKEEKQKKVVKKGMKRKRKIDIFLKY